MEKIKGLLKIVAIAKPGVGLLTLIATLTLMETFSSLLFPVFTQQIIDSFSELGELPVTWLVTLILLLTAGFIASGVNYYLIGKVANRMLVHLRGRTLKQALCLPVPYFDRNASAEPASRIVNDTQVINNLVAQHFEPFISGSLTLLASLTILWFLDWQLTAVLFSTLIVAFLITVPIAAKLAALSRNLQAEEASFLGYITERFAQIRLIKAATAERQAEADSEQSLNRLYRLGINEVKIGAIMAPIAGLTIVTTLIVILVFGATRVSLGEISMGTLIAFILYLFNIVFPLIQFTYFIAAFNKAAGAADRINELLNQPIEPLESSVELNLSQRDIQFKQVQFSYTPDQPIFQSLDLNIPANQTVALVGHSGAGKSTLFSLLLRYYSPDAGQITVNGTPLNTMELRSWRRQVAYVAQDAPLLSGSIRDNLNLGVSQALNDEALYQALENAQLTDLIAQLPDGLDSEIGERGVRLSGGQRQRLAIARALLQNSPFLLCDEATSNLDAATEHLVQVAMNKLRTNRTTIIAAHRLSTVLDADKIVVLKDGKVIAEGNHNALMEKSTYYRRLVEHQLKPFTHLSNHAEKPVALSSQELPVGESL